jgi:hypothetical protein
LGTFPFIGNVPNTKDPTQRKLGKNRAWFGGYLEIKKGGLALMTRSGSFSALKVIFVFARTCLGK